MDETKVVLMISLSYNGRLNNHNKEAYLADHQILFFNLPIENKVRVFTIDQKKLLNCDHYLLRFGCIIIMYKQSYTSQPDLV